MSISEIDDTKTKAFYVPVGGDGQLSPEFVIDALKPIIESSEIKKITYDAKVEYNVFRALNLKLNGLVFDVMLASYVNEPARNHDLDVQAIERINHIMCEFAPFEASRKKRIGILAATCEGVFGYGVDVAATIIDLTQFWCKELDKKELKLLRTIELPLSLVLADMEYIGVSIDVDYLQKLSQSMEGVVRRLERKIYQLAGEGFNLNSPVRLAKSFLKSSNLEQKRRRKVKNFRPVLRF